MLKKILSIFFLLAIILLIPATISNQMRDTASSKLKFITGPLIKAEKNTLNYYRSIRQIGQLRDDKNSLQNQVLNLQQKLIDQNELVRENDALKKELGVNSTTKNIDKLFAKVITQGQDPLDKTIIVDVGEKQGAKVGQPAVSEGFLVGRIITVRQNSSIVRLINSKDSKIQAWIAGNREKGLLIGDGNVIYLTEINQGVAAGADDMVETSGLGGSLPQGIIIGKIERTQSQPSDLSQKFIIQTPKEINLLESLFILMTDTN